MKEKIENFVKDKEDIIVIQRLIKMNDESSLLVGARISEGSVKFEKLFLEIQRLIEKFNKTKMIDIKRRPV